jgi:hypothetical protein
MQRPFSTVSTKACKRRPPALYLYCVPWDNPRHALPGRDRPSSHRSPETGAEPGSARPFLPAPVPGPQHLCDTARRQGAAVGVYPPGWRAPDWRPTGPRAPQRRDQYLPARLAGSRLRGGTDDAAGVPLRRRARGPAPRPRRRVSPPPAQCSRHELDARGAAAGMSRPAAPRRLTPPLQRSPEIIGTLSFRGEQP